MKKIQKLLCGLLVLGVFQVKANSSYQVVTSPVSFIRTGVEFKNWYAFTFVLDNDQLFSYGKESGGVEGGSIIAPLISYSDFKIAQIYSSSSAFTALSTEGKIISWGDPIHGGLTPLNNSNISLEPRSIVSNFTGFVARCNDGRLIEWGSLSLPLDLESAIESGEKVKDLYSGYNAFAAVLENPLNNTQRVISWGTELPATSNLEYIVDAPSPKVTVTSLVFSKGAFTVLFSNGHIESRGNLQEGGSIPEGLIPKGEKIKKIVAGQHAFAALSENGYVYAWGNKEFGGFKPTLPERTTAADLYGNDMDFSVLLGSKDIYCWGRHGKDPKVTQNEYRVVIPEDLTRTKNIWLHWPTTLTSPNKNEIVFVAVNAEAFVAVTKSSDQEQKVIAWGSEIYGGILPDFIKNEKKAVQSIVPAACSFSILYKDGTVGSWGTWGDGKTSIVTPIIPGKVKALTSNLRSYMAILENGSLFCWGGAWTPQPDGTFQPSADFSYGKLFYVYKDVSNGQSLSICEDMTKSNDKIPALWFASPFEKYIYNGPLDSVSSREDTSRVQ